MKKKTIKKVKIEKHFKKQVFFIEAEPYLQDILVVLNGTFEDAYKKLKKTNTTGAKENIKYIDENKEKYFEDVEQSVGGSIYKGLPYGFIVVIKVQKGWLATTGVVSHECLHLAFHILTKAGIVLVDESEEAFTYLQASLLKKILNKIY
jgi:hypothetical protein